MRQSEECFLAVAEELNFSRAARRLYLSSQCTSQQIKRLEKEKGVLLFQRKPRLKLTAEGEALVRALRRIQIIEDNLSAELNEISKGTEGLLRVGISITRVNFLMPVVEIFQARYPKVRISIYTGVIREMEKMLGQGMLDLVIGLGGSSSSTVKQIVLYKEKPFLIISDKLLKEYFPEQYPQCKEKFCHGVNLSEFKRVPMMFNYDTSTLCQSLRRYFHSHNIKVNVPFQISDSNIHFYLSLVGFGAFICPETILLAYGRMHPSDVNALNRFPLLDFSIDDPLTIGFHENAYLTKYAQGFMKAVQEVCELFGGVQIPQTV